MTGSRERSRVRILFCCNASTGHVNLLLPLVSAARRGGHDVRLATPAPFAEWLRTHGFPTVQCGLGWQDAETIELMRERGSRQGAEERAFSLVRIFAGAMARAMWHELSTFTRTWQPDVVVREMTEFGSSLVAESLDVPVATIVFGSASSDVRVIEQVSDALNERSAEARLDPTSVSTRLRRAKRIAMVPESYDPDEPPDVTVLRHRPVEVDDLDGQGCPPGVERLLASATIYATLGTVYHTVPGLLARVVDAFDGAGVNLILTTGDEKRLRELGSLPSNVFAAAYVPNSSIMSRCSGVVCHGGYSTTIGALLHGRPCVLLPRGADHFLHARCVTRLGAAVALDPSEQTAARLRVAISELLEETSMHAAARDLQRELEALPDIDTVVEAIAAGSLE